MHMCASMCVFHMCAGTYGDQMTGLDSLDLDLLAGVLGTDPGSSVRRASVNC